MLHKVETKIEISSSNFHNEEVICSGPNYSCENEVKWYCINDKKYFCNDCYEQVHEKSIFEKHEKVEIAKIPKDYGKCKVHQKKKNEFFCKCCSTAYCSECIVQDRNNEIGDKNNEVGDKNKENKKKPHIFINIEDAYKMAKDDAKNDDDALEEKKKVIETNL